MQQVAAFRDSQNDGLIATALTSPRPLPATEFHADVVLTRAAFESPVARAACQILPVVDRTSPARRTLVHAYEPVRNARQEVVDFRLTFDHATASEATRAFLGVQVVQCGPSVAPGEIFHTLKRVLESGEAHETVTRHVQGENEVCFFQTASKSGDTVVTTTSIVSAR